MKTHFACAFDKNFVIRGVATYRSIMESMPDVHFWFLCLDDETKPMVEKFKFKNVTCITLEEMGNAELMATRKDRNRTEFAMTSKSNFLSYLIHTKKVNDEDLLILTDVDMIFYPTLREFIEREKRDVKNSIFLTPHKFSKEKEPLIATVGYYNGGYITFRINGTSKACIHKWARQCINWCYLWHDYRNAWHTDQMYIDRWQMDFPGVFDLSDKGVNAGNWNIKNFRITGNEKDGYFFDGDPLVCYHFHGLKMYLNKKGKIRPYPICVFNKEIYEGYFVKLQSALEETLAIDPTWNYGFNSHPGILRIIKQKISRMIFK